MDDEPAKVYQVGEGFYEVPGAHHRISENASDKDPASLLAVLIGNPVAAGAEFPLLAGAEKEIESIRQNFTTGE